MPPEFYNGSAGMGGAPPASLAVAALPAARGCPPHSEGDSSGVLERSDARPGRGETLRRLEARCDGSQHGLGVLEHHAVLEPHPPDALCFEVSRSLGVVRPPRRVIVNGSVQFDGDSLARAVEVEDVRTDAVLSPEPSPEKLAPLKTEPERSLGRRAVGAEVTS